MLLRAGRLVFWSISEEKEEICFVFKGQVHEVYRDAEVHCEIERTGDEGVLTLCRAGIVAVE